MVNPTTWYRNQSLQNQFNFSMLKAKGISTKLKIQKCIMMYSTDQQTVKKLKKCVYIYKIDFLD
jgi:hypothetical protein